MGIVDFLLIMFSLFGVPCALGLAGEKILKKK